jgi:hypothetical protein
MMVGCLFLEHNPTVTLTLNSGLGELQCSCATERRFRFEHTTPAYGMYHSVGAMLA